MHRFIIMNLDGFVSAAFKLMKSSVCTSLRAYSVLKKL